MTSRRSDLPYDVLLLDFGGVCLLNPAELHHVLEARFGLPAGTFTFPGPLDPDADELYARSVVGDGLDERGYWAVRAAEVGEVIGEELDTFGYMRLIYERPGDELIRPEAVAVVAAARSAGLGVSIFTNDLTAFHGQEWVDAIDFLADADQIIDCSHAPFLKPEPAAYEFAAEQLRRAGVDDLSRVLFVDDRPLNAAGADVVDMDGLWFDIADAPRSWGRVADRLGIRQVVGSLPAGDDRRR